MLATRTSAKYTAEERALKERYLEVRRLKVLPALEDLLTTYVGTTK
jgi:hypothetical protein